MVGKENIINIAGDGNLIKIDDGFLTSTEKVIFFYKSRVRKKVLNSQRKECIPFTWQTFKDYLMKSHELRAGKGTRGDFMAYQSSEGRHYSRSWYVTRPIGGWH